MDVDPNFNIPVEIIHRSGAKFRINLSAEEIERVNTGKRVLGYRFSDPRSQLSAYKTRYDNLEPSEPHPFENGCPDYALQQGAPRGAYEHTDYKEHLVNKYYALYEDGFVSACNKDIEETQASEASSQAIESLPSTSRTTRPREWNVDDEETLIRLVSERPALYDFRLPLKERGRNVIKNLWEEVILELNVDMTVEAVSRKWKNIRDSFIRARANINKKLAFGSSAEEKVMAEKLRKNHKNYDLLLFLDDTLTTRRTTSNLDELVSREDDIRSPQFSPPSTPHTSRPTSRNQGQTVSAQDELFLNAIRDLPAPHELTPTQNFCMRLADGMDKLPPRIRNQIQVEFLGRLTEMENLYVYTE